MDSTLEDIEFLARSEHRIGALTTLAEKPRERHELCSTTGASSPTIGRILGDFEKRQWTLRDGPTYELTPLGEYVAERFADLQEAMDVERKLRDVWKWLPQEMEGFSVDMFANAVVAYPGPEYPYQPVERVTQLIETTDTVRGFGTTLYKTSNLEAFCHRVIDGMQVEYLYAPRILKAVAAWNPELALKAFECENCTILLHDALPDDDRCGLNIMDDCIGICGHDPKSAQLQAVIETNDPVAREWAVSVYEQHRADARPISEADKAELLPDDLAV